MREDVQQIIERFALVPHPEGGYFREVFRSKHRGPAHPRLRAPGPRAAAAAR